MAGDEMSAALALIKEHVELMLKRGVGTPRFPWLFEVAVKDPRAGADVPFVVSVQPLSAYEPPRRRT